MKLTAAVLVTSDRVARGERQDRSGELAKELLSAVAEVVEKRVVPDEAGEIRQALLSWSAQGVDVVVTVGGTGLSERDVTAQTTRGLLEKEAPGITMAMLARGLEATPRAMLSGAAAGVRGRTLIVNLPGSMSAVRDYIGLLREILPHAVAMIHGHHHEQ